jgi:hypothetical protein
LSSDFSSLACVKLFLAARTLLINSVCADFCEIGVVQSVFADSEAGRIDLALFILSAPAATPAHKAM